MRVRSLILESRFYSSIRLELGPQTVLWPSCAIMSSSTSSADAGAAAAAAAATGGGAAVPAGAKYIKRKLFQHQGRTIYEWEQDIEAVEMWIKPPPGVTAKIIDCTITENHLKLGIKGNPPFINEDFHATVVVDESFWMMG
jgi:hypothetical protein